MPDLPKIVYDRLRAGQRLGDHPDADVLTAFAEQGLSGVEREGVVAHLASCRECREVVALSLPALETAQPMPVVEPVDTVLVPARVRRRSWFAWPRLRWAALAAGVVVVASVLTLRPGRQTPAVVSKTNEPAEKLVSGAPAAENPPPAPDARVPAPSRAQSREQTAPAASRARTVDEGRMSSKVFLDSPAAVGGFKKDTPAVIGGALAGYRQRKDSSEADKLTLTAPSSAPEPTSRGAQSIQVGAASETVEVSGADVAVNQAPAEKQLQARNESLGAIEKAKPPTRDHEETRTLAKAKAEASGASSNYAPAYANALVVPPESWRISEGALQRSLDSGSTWEMVLRPDRSLLCDAVRGTEIWVGGQAGTLYHSADGGITWTRLHPVSESQPLSADITNILLGGTGAVSLTTSGAESWTTADNGRTWSKKRLDRK